MLVTRIAYVSMMYPNFIANKAFNYTANEKYQVSDTKQKARTKIAMFFTFVRHHCLRHATGAITSRVASEYVRAEVGDTL